MINSIFAVDLVLLNGNIISMSRTVKDAEAVAVRDGRIVKVGKNSDVKRLVGEKTEVVDLEGKTLIPGFVDTHCHPLALGLSLGWVNLRHVGSIEKLKDRVRKFISNSPRGSWIQGFGWDQDRFKEKRFPTRWDLDEVSEDNPIILTRYCGHISVVNSKALEIAGVTKDTDPPEGGVIDKDPVTGEPTGLLKEGAIELVKAKIPKLKMEELCTAVERACSKAVSTGITTLHWIAESAEEIEALQRVYHQKGLPLRVRVLVPEKLTPHLIGLGLRSNFGDSFLRIGAVKLFVDGSLGARTAALEEPYSDDPSTRGVMVHTPEELRRIVSEVDRAGLQVAMHAIGDRAIREALNALSEILGSDIRRDHRHRLEHVTVLNKTLLERMVKLNVFVTIQPHFVVSDFWAPDRVGPSRSRFLNAYKSLLKSGLRVSCGSDCPVEPIDPLIGIEAAVAREVNPEERLTVDEALEMYTLNGAYASFEEDEFGSIEEGKLADMTVLSDDPRKVPPSEIGKISVEMTIVDGRIVYNP